MADKDYLAWPFFDGRHADLEAALDEWAAQNVRGLHGADVDADCRKLVRMSVTVLPSEAIFRKLPVWTNFFDEVFSGSIVTARCAASSARRT